MSRDVLTQRRRGAESGVATYVRLGDVCEQVRGVSYKPTDASLEPKEGYVPLLRANNIFEGVINHDDLVFVRQDRILASQYLRQGDVLVCTSSGSVKLVGKAAQIQANSHESFGAFCRVLRPNARLSARYFHHYFQSDTYRRTISNKAAGANINNIRSEDLDELSIPLPPLAEQRRITAKLDRICDIIAKRKQQLVKLQQLVKSRFVEMFGDPVSNPKKWNVRRISEFADVRIGPFGSLLHKEDYIQGGHPLVNPSHMVDGKIVPDNDLTLSDIKYKELVAYQLRLNDVVIARRGEIGRCALVKKEGFFCGTGSMFVRIKKDCRADYLQRVISYPTFAARLEDAAVGITMKNINAGMIEDCTIPLPPPALQREFAAFVAKVDKLAFAVRKSLESAEKLYRQQLSEAFA